MSGAEHEDPRDAAANQKRKMRMKLKLKERRKKNTPKKTKVNKRALKKAARENFYGKK
jgi:hypothetical protein